MGRTHSWDLVQSPLASSVVDCGVRVTLMTPCPHVFLLASPTSSTRPPIPCPSFSSHVLVYPHQRRTSFGADPGPRSARCPSSFHAGYNPSTQATCTDVALPELIAVRHPRHGAIRRRGCRVTAWLLELFADNGTEGTASACSTATADGRRRGRSGRLKISDSAHKLGPGCTARTAVAQPNEDHGSACALCAS